MVMHHLAIASVLLRDGFLERARKILEDVDVVTRVSTCSMTLVGLTAFRQRRFKDAAEALDTAWSVETLQQQLGYCTSPI